MVYVVVGRWVDYDDKESWIVKAFKSREKAQAYASECDLEAVEVRKRYQSIYKEWGKWFYSEEDWSKRVELAKTDKSKKYEAEMQSCVGTLDSHYYASYGDLTTYTVEECELEE